MQWTLILWMNALQATPVVLPTQYVTLSSCEEMGTKAMFSPMHNRSGGGVTAAVSFSCIQVR
jgi:hypothetical protein